MGRFHRGRHQWKERNVAHDGRHRWPVSVNSVAIGAIELHGSAFVAYSVKDELANRCTRGIDADAALANPPTARAHHRAAHQRPARSISGWQMSFKTRSHNSSGLRSPVFA